MTEAASLSLKNRNALVTGASRGIGRAIALELGSRGANVAVNYLRSSAKAEEVVEAIRAGGGDAQAVQGDVSDFSQAQDLTKAVIKAFGGLDILVNNAGIIRDNLIMRMKEEDWDAVLTTNLKSTFNCSKAVVRQMMRQKHGRIINITSIAGQMGNPGQTNYSASKAGQIGFTKSLAREVASRNITVNAIAPGFVETDILEETPQEAIDFILNQTPMGRMAIPEEVAYVAAFLASDQAAYITGQVIAVDGGMAMF